MTSESRALFPGNDNYGKPRQDYVSNLEKLSDEELLFQTEQDIWLSAYAANNPRSDYHWQATACYHEWQCRAKPEQYQKAYDAARSGAS